MTTLKDLTIEEHKNAERQAFVQKIFKGEISNFQYATYLKNQHAKYDILEAIAMMHGLFNDMPEIRRAPFILEDFKELWSSENEPYICNTTTEYTRHLMNIKNDTDKIMAHIYVRHMGDLSGGQILAKKIPGSGKMYQFDRSTDELKSIIRSKINNSMAEEAKICFNFATDLFQELEEKL